MATVSTPTPDPVLDTQMFWARNKNTILTALAVVLLALAAYGAYRFYTGHRNEAAASMLSQAKNAADYQKIVDQYRDSSAAPGAYLLLAAAQRKEQKLAEANTTLKRFVEKNPKHEFVTVARMAMAANVDALGNPDEALEMYRRVAADYPKSFNAPLALLAQVPLLKQKGDVEGARRVCETVLTQYRDNYASTEATRHLRMLKAPAADQAISPAEPAVNSAPTIPAAASPAGSMPPTP